MLLLYERKVTIAGRVCVASTLAFALSLSLDALAPQLWNIPPILYRPLLLTNAISFWYACWATIKGKGYSGWVGLAFPFIAIVLKDRHKNESPTGAEMLPPKTTSERPQLPIRICTIAATLLNLALLVSVAYLLLKNGIPNVQEAWLVGLMLLAPMVSLYVIYFASAQDRLLSFLRRGSLGKRVGVDEVTVVKGIEYITNPTFVRWFGLEVTRVRAGICGVGALLNSHLLLAGSTSTSHSRSLWDVVMEIVDFFLMIGFNGPVVVFIFYALGVLVSIVLKSIIPWDPRLVRDDLIDEWSINLTIVAGELIFVWGYLGGFS